jgi:hypothetical protein
MVLMSMTTEPGRAPSMTPPGPSITSSTAWESVSMVTVMSCRAASAAESAVPAPAATGSSIRAAVRFHTVTS